MDKAEFAEICMITGEDQDMIKDLEKVELLNTPTKIINLYSYYFVGGVFYLPQYIEIKEGYDLDNIKFYKIDSLTEQDVEFLKKASLIKEGE